MTLSEIPRPPGTANWTSKSPDGGMPKPGRAWYLYSHANRETAPSRSHHHEQRINEQRITMPRPPAPLRRVVPHAAVSPRVTRNPTRRAMPAWAGRIVEQQLRRRPRIRLAIDRSRRLAHTPPLECLKENPERRLI